MEGTIPAVGSISTSIITSVVNRIVRTRTISRTDQRLLMGLLSKSILSDTDMNLINRVYSGLYDGRIRVVD